MLRQLGHIAAHLRWLDQAQLRPTSATAPWVRTNVSGVIRHGSRMVGVDTLEAGRFACHTLINAAGSWASELCQWASGRPIPVRPIKGQIVLTGKIPKLLRGCITTSDCYIAQKDNGEILIGSTISAGKPRRF